LANVIFFVKTLILQNNATNRQNGCKIIVKNLENPYNIRILTIFNVASFLSTRLIKSKKCRNELPQIVQTAQFGAVHGDSSFLISALIRFLYGLFSSRAIQLLYQICFCEVKINIDMIDLLQRTLRIFLYS